MSSRPFFSILLIFLILAAAYSIVLPLAEAPDEADHYAYVRYLGLNGSLPEGPFVTQGKHPPLYHAAAAALTAATGLDFSFLRSNPDALPLGPGKPPNLFVHTSLEAFPWRGGALAMHLARLLSVLLGAVTLWATWMLGREIFPDRPAIGLVAAAFLAGLPGFLFISASINNDNAAGAFGALALLLAARILRRGLSLRRTLLLGLVLGLGLLSKVGTLALWPLVLLAVGGAWWLGPRALRLWRGLLAHLALGWGLGLLVASPWLLRNWRLYGDPLAWDLVRATVDQRTAPLALADLAWLLRGLHVTFWGRFGGAGQVQLPAWAYGLALALTAILVAGIVRNLWRLWREGVRALQAIEPSSHSAIRRLPPVPRPGQTPPSAPLLALLPISLLALAPFLVFASIVRYSAIALGTDQARLMWPALAAMAVWVGVGVDGLTGATWQRASSVESGVDQGSRVPARDSAQGLVLWFTVAMAVVGLVVLAGVIRPAFAPPKPVAADSLPAVPSLARFGQQLELVAAEVPAVELPLGSPVSLRLFWRTQAPLVADLRPTVRLVHDDGWLAAEWSHAPAGGRYATDRWRPGEVIADDYLMAPQPSAPGTYTLEVGVRPFGAEWVGVEPGDPGYSFLPLGRVTYR